MLIGTCIALGGLANNVLTEGHGQILAVFTNTVYLQASDGICCLGTRSIIEGPINIRTDLSRLDHLNVGGNWHCGNGVLALAGRYQLKTDTARTWKQPPTAPTTITNVPGLALGIATIESTLAEYSDQTNNQTKTATIAENRLHRYQELLTDYLRRALSQQQTEVPPGLTGIIGCGDGLTPAGDDILAGALITLHHFHQQDCHARLSRWVLDNAPALTNNISIAHLSAACNGQGICHLHKLLSTVSVRGESNAAQQSVSVAAGVLCDYGHSSGYYALTGVYAVLSVLADLQTGKLKSY